MWAGVSFPFEAGNTAAVAISTTGAGAVHMLPAHCDDSGGQHGIWCGQGVPFCSAGGVCDWRAGMPCAC